MRHLLLVFLPIIAGCGAHHGDGGVAPAAPSPSSLASAPPPGTAPTAIGHELHGQASEPVAPFAIVGNLYYVGARNIASYLFTSPQGHILLDTGTREMVPIVQRNIEQLGFRLADVKIMLSGHAHFDHVQGHAAIQRATGAQVFALGDDAVALERGQDRSPLGAEGWEPVHVDRVLGDLDTVQLGGTTLTAHWAPGHTPGCTVWTANVPERDRTYAVAFYACAGPNADVQLIHNPAFPNLAADALATFHRLRSLHPDLVLMMHPEEQFAGKLDRLRAGARPHPLYDPDAWRKLLNEGEADLRARVRRAQVSAAARARQQRLAPPPRVSPPQIANTCVPQ